MSEQEWDALLDSFDLVLVDEKESPVARASGGNMMASSSVAGGERFVLLAVDPTTAPVSSPRDATVAAGVASTGAVEVWRGAEFAPAPSADEWESRPILSAAHQVYAMIPHDLVLPFSERYEYVKTRVGSALIEFLAKIGAADLSSIVALRSVTVDLVPRRSDMLAATGTGLELDANGMWSEHPRSIGIGLRGAGEDPAVRMAEAQARKAELREALLAERAERKAQRDLLFQREYERARGVKEDIIQASEEHALLQLSMEENKAMKHKIAALEKMNADLEAVTHATVEDANRNKELMEQWYDAYTTHTKLLEQAKEDSKRSVALERQRAERERMELQLKALKEKTDAERKLSQAAEQKRLREAEIRRIEAEKMRVEAEQREAELRAELERDRLEKQLQLESLEREKKASSLHRIVGRAFKLAHHGVKSQKVSNEESHTLKQALAQEEEERRVAEARMVAYQQEIAARDDAREELLRMDVEIGIAVANHEHKVKKRAPSGEPIVDIVKTVRVVSVREGGPAELAGLRKGDVVRRAGNIKVIDRTAFLHVLHAAFPGEEEVFMITRDHTKLAINVQYGAVGYTLQHVNELRHLAGKSWCEARDSDIDDISDIGKRLLDLQQSMGEVPIASVAVPRRH